MHILFLTDNFPPEGNAPATRTFEHAKYWITLGHQVTIITGAPNFPEGRVFDGYENNWYSKEFIEGIEVRRVKTFVTSNEGFLKRILDFLSFMVSSFFAGLFVKKPDVIVGTSPQFFTIISGYFLAKIKRRPFVFELRDIWPASITAVGAMKDSLIIKVLEKIEMFLYKHSSRIVAVTESFKNELIERGVNEQKIGVVLNGVDLSTYKPVDSKNIELETKYALTNKFIIGYVGTHGLAHALDSILDAAKLIASNDEVRFLFVGGGAAKKTIDDRINSEGLNNVISIARQPKSSMPEFWSLCDLSLISLKDTDLFKTVIPSKIFESMGMGIPLLVSMPKGEATQIVESTHSGVIVKAEQPLELVKAIERIYSDHSIIERMSENAKKASKTYNRESLASAFIDELEIAIEEYLR
ncbi:glycosyltransferase family 4 protein [Glaciecola petra]|uniref:Glycosyltransferase family 4 protein n=1 Tax=Glaciecola petra TaxID=3075602 RepID=A0ABU2ZMN9_9ALTE|nr:glycosyltransferase family 4 protein [Aestuariibacter sp. P117]MDT0593675.1 glycosyltransferase family 4 protein [Aestuariibacter sp. P117]